jgi:transcriptional regulator with XRE-family HTH domain
MAQQIGPSVARERLRHRLRELRTEKGLTTAHVADAMDWSVSKLTRIEKGDVTVQPLEVRALLNFYGVKDDADVRDLAGLARKSRTRQWYSRHNLNGDYQKFVALENEAARINVWQVMFIPGLLQTPEYAIATTSLATRKGPEDDSVKARVDLRLERQREFRERLRQPDPPRITAVIDESTLRRPIGGPEVFVPQLDHLLDLGGQPQTYTIAVMPLGLTHNPGVTGTFELLQFTGDQPDALFVEAAASTDDLTMHPDTTAFYRAVMADLLAVSLTGDAARDLIRGIRSTHAA